MSEDHKTLFTDCPQRVALDLAFRIDKNDQTAQKDRRYWLTLYRQCLLAVTGRPVESALKEE